MPTDTSEKGLESLLVEVVTGELAMRRVKFAGEREKEDAACSFTASLPQKFFQQNACVNWLRSATNSSRSSPQV
jgi:hypothetical protein